MPNSGTTVAMASGSLQPNGTAYMVQGGETFEMVTDPQVLTKFYVPINKNITYYDGNDATDELIDYWKYQWIIVQNSRALPLANTASLPYDLPSIPAIS